MICSKHFIDRLNTRQKEALFQAGIEAGRYAREHMMKATNEIRKQLQVKGMKITYPEKKSLIRVALQVQNKFAEKKGAEFQEFLHKVRKADQ